MLITRVIYIVQGSSEDLYRISYNRYSIDDGNAYESDTFAVFETNDYINYYDLETSISTNNIAIWGSVYNSEINLSRIIIFGFECDTYGFYIIYFAIAYESTWSIWHVDDSKRFDTPIYSTCMYEDNFSVSYRFYAWDYSTEE